MPRILQAQDLGPRPSLTSDRQVVRDRSGEIEAYRKASARWCGRYGMGYGHWYSGSGDFTAVVSGTHETAAGCQCGAGVALRQPEPHNPFGLRFDSLEATSAVKTRNKLSRRYKSSTIL